MEDYYIELAREALSKAIREIGKAQEYLLRGGDSGRYCQKLGKQISGLQNRSREILHDRK